MNVLIENKIAGAADDDAAGVVLFKLDEDCDELFSKLDDVDAELFSAIDGELSLPTRLSKKRGKTI